MGHYRESPPTPYKGTIIQTYLKELCVTEVKSILISFPNNKFLTIKVNVSKEITSKQQNYILQISLLSVIHLFLDIKPELKLCSKKTLWFERSDWQNKTRHLASLDVLKGNDSGF